MKFSCCILARDVQSPSEFADTNGQSAVGAMDAKISLASPHQPLPLSAAYRAQRANGKGKAAAAPEFVVLYASQTGTAQEVARSIHAASSEQSIRSKVRPPPCS